MRSKIRKKISPLNVTLLIVLSLYTLSMFIMLAWGILTSLKTVDGYLEDPVGLPKQWAFENFVTVFMEFKLKRSVYGVGDVTTYIEGMALNSILYSVGGALIQAFVPCFMAYLTAKFRYKFSNVLFWVVTVTMTIPIVGEAPSAIQLMNSIGLYDTIFGNWIQKFSFLGMYFLVFYATFKDLPNDYAEAAYVDGAGETRIFFQIIFPLVRNMFLTVVLLKFIDFWNDYQTALIYLPSYPTIAYGVYYMSVSKDNDLSATPLRMASSVIMLVPILVIFLIFKDRIMNNVSMGGIKE